MATTFLVLSDRVGEGDDEFGGVLMRSFLYYLARNEESPARLMFMNAGVRLTCEGSESLDDLALLAEAGAAISSCGTCLDYYKLADTLRVGTVGAMQGAVAALAGGTDVVTIR